MPAFQTYRSLPAIETGYPLDDVWSVVVPIARTNEVLNPSFETNTTGYTAGSGSLARSTAQQYHGAYSGAYTPAAAVNDGFFYGTITTTSGQIRAIHCKFRGATGVPYALTLATTGGVDLVTKPFIAMGRWQWIILYYTETSSTTRRIYFRKNNSVSVAVFYVDGVNSEVIQAGELASTHIDGDQLGLVPNQSPPAYVWNGTPHASTSTRSGLTRAGGMVIPFKKYGFILMAMIGLGLAQPQNVATSYARIDGAYDDYTRKPPRQFTLTGRWQGRTYAELRRQRSGLADLLDRDLVGQDQRLTLLRHVEDRNGNTITSDIRVLAKYESGLGGNTDNMHAETTPITFTAYLPGILSDGEAGSALTVQLSVANANAILRRSAGGVWSAMSTGMSGGTDVRTIVQGLDGTIYAGGAFTDAGGSGADNIAQWNGSAWSVIGSATALGSAAITMAIGPDGSLYVGGGFVNVNGIANADGIAKWNGSAWSALGTGAAGGGATVYALAFGADGTLYAAGDFASMGGVANTNCIAKWNGTAWSAMGTGAAGGSAGVFALAAVGNTIYAGGDFDNMGGVAAADDLARWNGTAWSALGAAGTTGGSVNALVIGPNSILYIGGAFTTLNGLNISYLAQWNGVAFTGIGTFDSVIYALSLDRSGILHIGGQFTTVNGVAYPDGAARLIGSTVVPESVDFPGAAQVHALLSIADGTLYAGFTTTGTATAEGTTTITNLGTAKAYPTIIIKGPTANTARIFSIVNPTTGRAIYLNLTLNVGETATLVFQPDNLSFTSDFQGNIASAILPGSNVADFFLQPGTNTIAFLSADSTVVATLYYRPAFASIDDVS